MDLEDRYCYPPRHFVKHHRMPPDFNPVWDYMKQQGIPPEKMVKYLAEWYLWTWSAWEILDDELGTRRTVELISKMWANFHHYRMLDILEQDPKYKDVDWDLPALAQLQVDVWGLQGNLGKVVKSTPEECIVEIYRCGYEELTRAFYGKEESFRLHRLLEQCDNTCIMESLADMLGVPATMTVESYRCCDLGDGGDKCDRYVWKLKPAFKKLFAKKQVD